MSRFRFRWFLCAALLLGALTLLGQTRAHAGVVDSLRASLGIDGRESKEEKRQAARAARARASLLDERADSVQGRLRGVQRTLLRANEHYFDYRRLVRRTEAQILRARAKREAVNERYDQRRKLFGQRLAAMQRTGRTGYLQIFLGSRTLSDLTRRFTLFRALVTRDAQLQQNLRDDKTELQSLNDLLVKRWKQRSTLERRAGQERLRIAQAASEQQKALSRIVSSRNDLLDYSANQVESIKDIDREVAQYNARQRARAAQAAAEAEAQDQAEYQLRSNRIANRLARSNDDDDEAPTRRWNRPRSSYRSSYRSRRTGSYRRRSRVRYRTTSYRRRAPRGYAVRLAKRIDRVRYVPAPGGKLKPMSISEIVFKDEVMPVARGSGGQAKADSSATSNGGNSFPPPPADDFPASDP